MKAVVFAGPSLPPRARVPDPAFDWRPPARQGDVYRAALARPAMIAIVDGYFEAVPTVWHKEVLFAMARGIHVYGAASTGALRAAELATFGMKGVGQIYEAYRDGKLEDDDEVAVLHGPAELGYPALTEAMVNIRATLAKAVSEQILDAVLAARLAETGKRLFYKERRWEAVLRLAATPEELGARLDRLRIDQKRRDALAMVAAIREHLAQGVAPLEVDFTLNETSYFRAAAQLPG